MKRRRAKYAIACCLLVAAGTVCANVYAKSQEQQSSEPPPMLTTEAKNKDLVGNAPRKREGDAYEPAIENSNSLGVPFLKNLASDQKAIWTSPSRLHWADGTWLFPLAAVTGGFFATDRAVPPALSTDPKKLNRYSNFSNYGVYSLVGAGGGLYVWSKLSHDDHQRETGILAGEAAIDSLGVDTAFKYAFGRERPNQGQGLGNFFQGGDSFPSDHSAVAWSIASVIAHEYPGPFTQIAVVRIGHRCERLPSSRKAAFPVGCCRGWRDWMADWP